VRPEPGDTLVGESGGWSTFEKTDPESGEKKTCEILTVRDRDGVEHAVWCWHSILKADLVGKVARGDMVAISYVGKKPRQSGDGAYHHYRVAVEKSADEAKVSPEKEFGF
jgi:hypothetical protein